MGHCEGFFHKTFPALFVPLVVFQELSKISRLESVESCSCSQQCCLQLQAAVAPRSPPDNLKQLKARGESLIRSKRWINVASKLNHHCKSRDSKLPCKLWLELFSLFRNVVLRRNHGTRDVRSLPLSTHERTVRLRSTFII